jgi:type II secretion system protein G
VLSEIRKIERHDAARLSSPKSKNAKEDAENNIEKEGTAMYLFRRCRRRVTTGRSDARGREVLPMKNRFWIVFILLTGLFAAPVLADGTTDEQRIAALEAKVAELEKRVAALEEQLARIAAPPRARNEQADRAAATAQISNLRTALDTFEIDNGRYPTTAEGLVALVKNPGNLSSWKQYVDSVPMDPWGHPYIYRCPGSNGKDFDLLSAGPDGQEGTGDDVK